MRRLAVVMIVLISVALALFMPDRERRRLREQAHSILYLFDESESGGKGTSQDADSRQIVSIDQSDIGWYEWLEYDENSDLVNAYTRLDADSRSLEGFGGESWEKPHIVVRCMGGETAVFIVWTPWIEGLSESSPFLVSIDGGLPVEVDWTLADNAQAAGFWRSEGVPFLKSLEQAHSLVVYLGSDDSDTQRQMEFDVSAMSEKIKPVRETCNW